MKRPQSERIRKVHEMIQKNEESLKAKENEGAKSGSGSVHVDSYSRSDGTQVDSYYRSRPHY